MFRKTKEKRDLLPLQAVCRKDEEADPVSSIPDLYTAIEFFYFIFYERLDRYFLLLPFYGSANRVKGSSSTLKLHR